MTDQTVFRNTVPINVDTLIIKIRQALKHEQYFYGDWHRNRNGYAYYEFQKKSMTGAILQYRYYPMETKITIFISSLSQYLYGNALQVYSPADYKRLKRRLAEDINTQFNLEIVPDVFDYAVIRRLDLNQDFYFSNDVYADAFIDWTRRLPFSKVLKKYNYESGFKIRNDSWNLTVYDKKKACEDKNMPFKPTCDAPSCVRFEIQLKDGCLDYMFGSKKKKKSPILKKIKNCIYLYQLLGGTDFLYSIWLDRTDSLCFRPTIVSKALMPEIVQTYASYNGAKTKAQQNAVNYYLEMGEKGYAAVEDKPSRHRLNRLLRDSDICSIYMEENLLIDLSRWQKNNIEKENDRKRKRKEKREKK